MLIIGGIAVPLASLPDWAQHLSAFFPGRYAVQAVQATVIGEGLGAVRFDLLALTLIGAAGCVAGAMMFRWDAQQRFVARGRRGWVLVALGAWVMVGTMAEMRNRVSTTPGGRAARSTPVAPAPSITVPAPRAGAEPPPEPTSPPATAPSTPPPPAARGSAAATTAPVESSRPAEKPQTSEKPQTGEKSQPPAMTPGTTTPGAGSSTEAPPPEQPQVQQPIAPTWQAVKLSDIDRDLVFDRLPADAGIVAPIAPPDEEPPAEVIQTLESIRVGLPNWAPAKVPDAVQRARNVLYVAAVPDVLQTELERFAPYVVFEQLEHDIPKEDLMRALYWIALHPMDGEDSAIDQLPMLGFENRAVDVEQVRERVAIYSVKLLGRLTGAIPR
jgi:hypothetical protein